MGIGIIYEELGPKIFNAILGFHTFTGCDQIGRFNGKSKSTCWSSFIKSSDDILEAFSRLGASENLPDLQTIEALERFIINLYHPKKAFDNLSHLRWHLFSKYQQEGDKLPPTFSALKFKMFRAHFVTMILRRSTVSIQALPPVINYGWELVDEMFSPIMTDNLPAPSALIEMVSCACKSNCTTNRCQCRKNSLNCTDMCKCEDCENDDYEKTVTDESDDDENYDL